MIRGILLAVLVLLSCTAPLYERAHIDKGISFGAGVGAFTTTPRSDDYVGVGVTGFWREGLSERFGYGIQATVVGFITGGGWGYVGSGSAKWRFSRNQALLINVGFPHPVGIDLLQDVGDLITFRVNAGCDPGILERHANVGCSVDLHPMRDHRRYHISGDVCHMWGGDGPWGFVGRLGVALELLEER